MNKFKMPSHSNSAAILGMCECSNCSKSPLQESNRTKEDMEVLRRTLTTLRQQYYDIEIDLIVLDRHNEIKEIKLNGKTFNIKTANIFLQQLIQARLEVDNALERLNYRRCKLGLPAIKLRKAD